MLELIVASFLGIIIGCVTGMIPGIHVNTAGAIIFASSTFLLSIFSPEFLCAERSEERRVGKECRSRWSPYH